MILDYYKAALSRSLFSAWDWAVAQGILLTWFLAICALLITVMLAVWRAHANKHSWTDAIKIAVAAFRDFALTVAAAALLLFFLLFAAFFVLDAPGQAVLAKKKIDDLQTKIEIQNAKGLLAECHATSPPATLPTNGHLYQVLIFGDGRSEQLITMAESFGPPNGATAWLAGLTALNFLQCGVTNYSDEVLIDVDLRPKLDFFRMAKGPDGGLRGEGIESSKDSYVHIAKIDPGADKPFIFYFVNQTPIFIQVEMPASASAQHLNGVRVTVPVASTPKLPWLSVYLSPPAEK